MIIFYYLSYTIFNGFLLSSSQQINEPDFRMMEIPAHPYDWTDVESTQLQSRHKRSLHRRRRDQVDVGRSTNIVDADEVDSRRHEAKRSWTGDEAVDDDEDESRHHEAKRSQRVEEAVGSRRHEAKGSRTVEETDSTEKKTFKIVEMDDQGNSEEKKVDDHEDKRHKRFKSSPKRGPKRKHHTKRVVKKETAIKTTDPTPGREKRSFVRDRYVGDTLFALELFLLFIPLACVGVVVLSLLHVCWSRTCQRDSEAHSEWTSEVKVSPPVNVTPKKKMNDIVNELVTNEVNMAGGDATGGRPKLSCPVRKKSLHKQRPPVVDPKREMSSPSDPPKSSSSLLVVGPPRGHFISTATFDSHFGGRKGLRLKAYIKEQRGPQRIEEGKFEGLRGSRPEKDESPQRRSVDVNKRRHKAKGNPIEDSSLSSSFQYPNYYPHDKFYHREQ